MMDGTMNHCVPDWNLEDYSRPYTDLPPVSNQKNFLGPEQEFVELLWQNGLVVMNSQTHRKPIPSTVESEHVHKPEERLKGEGSFGNSSILTQEENFSWLQYPLDDLIENEFSDLFDSPTILDFKETNEPSKAVAGGNRDMKVGDPKDMSCSVRPQPVYRKQYNLDPVENVMPPPKLQVPNSTPQAFNLGTGSMVNFMHFLRPRNASIGWPNDLSRKKGPSTVVQGELAESSMMRNCGSNDQVSSNSLSGAKEVVHKRFTQNERWQIDALEPTVVSSSGGSEGSLTMTKETASNQSLKRKSRDIDESKCQSEEAEFVPVEANKPPQRSASTHQSCVAEVHNLSERRRRDIINEKMKALQELIPHSNKSDKASMLDETIEYLKSLQLQLQIMWMGNGMAQMMVPGVQNYMLPMGIGVDHAQIHGPLQSPRVPVIDQSLTSTLAQNHPTICPSATLNSFRFQNQMQNANMPESYARYLGFHPVNCPSPMLSSFSFQNQVQNANMPESYARDLGFSHIQTAPQAMQHGQRMAPPVSSEQQCNGITTDNILTGTLGLHNIN